ncbi:N-acetylglutamate synthase mitochondrial [Biomphalaria glabrata]|uniref:N-acetylglutamate synthase, mitochondrial-like n=1 Tax=Biomphalaria glabrata TaxID=6526 RepID=A0A9U8E9T1_BIOGL|nr:N-acetylglutamate synthase, mitochondrial-like [Biomphalaria glabrata]XP_013078965.2 N-acetylglutamate synthase, mitochondrial-like [Biomphalaria glabrata]KAI8744942.1 N-acetylglutamate synthase; mitochondrial-like [Biomphalaria glabrata]
MLSWKLVNKLCISSFQKNIPLSLVLPELIKLGCRKNLIRSLVTTSRRFPFSNGDFMSNLRNSDLSRFLIEIGTDPKEARYWLKTFKSHAGSSDLFMVVTVDNGVLENHSMLEKFASSISFLYRNGISPLLVCGGEGNQSTFMARKDYCIRNALKLNDILESHGTNARVLYPGCGVVSAERPEHGGSGTGHLLNVSLDIIKSSLATQHLPIVLSYGETTQGQIFPISSWELTAQMSRLLQPKKVMLINLCGGFLDEQGKVIANINLPTDLVSTENKIWKPTEELTETMINVNKLLCELPTDSSVVITSADTMLRELFSHQGSGTFFRSAEAIHRYTSLDKIDLDRLRALLHKSFLKALTDTYFDEISSQIHAVYLSESYSGVAIILKSPTQVPYMCKFAVTNKAQGQGTGEMLWDHLLRCEPHLFWRSKTDNPINTWYFKKCEGSYNNHMWLVFWYGVSDPNLSAGLIKDALRRSESFVPNGFIHNIPSDDEEERMGG